MDKIHSVPKPEIVSSPEVKKDKRTMDFGTCLKKLIVGGRYRRLEWADTGVYVIMHEGKLMIKTESDEALRPLTVSDGDILGEDWVWAVDAKEKMN
jgi:hypothetical protein